MSKLNLYFFDEEEVGITDAMYFYGTQIAVLSILAFSLAITLIK